MSTFRAKQTLDALLNWQSEPEIFDAMPLLRTHIVIGAFFAFVIGVPIFAFFHAPNRGELFDKRGWSVLQGMNDPPSPSSGAVLVRRDEFAVLGFRGTGEPRQRSVYGPAPHWSWVLLNEHQADGEIKQMPEFGAYDLHCAELQRTEKAVPDADAYAVRHLRSICT